MPALIQSLGVEKFGILTLIWAVAGYFSLFDFGLARALTQPDRVEVAAKDESRARSSRSMLGLGIFAGIGIAVAAPFLSSQFVSSGDIAEVMHAFVWMALAMPVVALTSRYRGILETVGRFRLINAIRFPIGVFTLAVPLALVGRGDTRLDIISAVLCFGRIVACFVYGWYAVGSVPGSAGHGHVVRTLIKSLLSMGGWISVSNIVSPLIICVRLFALGFVVSAFALTFDATTQGLIFRVAIVLTAVAAELLQPFAAERDGADHSADKADVLQYSPVIFALLRLLTLILFFFAPPLLAWGVSPEFASSSTGTLQILSIVSLASGLVRVPFAMLQGQGRAEIAAKLHVAELRRYLALLSPLIMHYGASGSAWTWLIRISADMVAMYHFCSRSFALRNEPAASAEGKAVP